jgi:hypothetical protein
MHHGGVFVVFKANLALQAAEYSAGMFSLVAALDDRAAYFQMHCSQA